MEENESNNENNVEDNMENKPNELENESEKKLQDNENSKEEKIINNNQANENSLKNDTDINSDDFEKQNIENMKEEIIEEVEELDVITTDGLKISNDAVATYAGIAIAEVQGVYSMAGAFGGFTEAISGKKNFSRGIKVDSDGKTAKIDVSIIVEYGARIPDVAFEIQTVIKKSVESMTGLKVNEVNVHVNGVHLSSKDEKEDIKQDQKDEIDE